MTTEALNPSTCYRAFASRDRRFDGAFFMAVRTTGVYCRAGCPARLPARRNVRFFPSAAAAESAGFRACFRCRPDAAPGSPAWAGTTATVARALRLIEESALAGVRVERVAERLGVSSRWLRRLFEEQLGAAPRDVARTQRAHFARRLIEESRMPLADIALASGFGGERRLRAAIRTAFHRSPAELRHGGLRARTRAAGESQGAVSAGVLELRLPARTPFDARPLMAFFAPRAIGGIERVRDGVYARSFRLDGVTGWLQVQARPESDALTLRVASDSPRALLPVAGRVSRMFDLGADVRGIARVLRRDPLLASRLPRAGVRVPGAWDPFEAGVRAILGQQISVAAAHTLAARLVRAFGEPLRANGAPESITHVFPTPDALAGADLSGFGLTRARAATLRGFAAAIAERRLVLDAPRATDELVAALTALPGIGEWTAQYLAMRALGEPDAFPASDLGVRKALARGSSRPSVAQVLERAERWRPWRAYAVIALWSHES
jgi:AraC family transcriptional regulator, regulatory protein of adaptative response / DNA-3-methyladenine glycosylase II